MNGGDAEIAATLREGCWTPRESFALGLADADWSAAIAADSAASRFTVQWQGRAVGEVSWPLLGEHNVMNALAAIAAARHAGVPPERSARALNSFLGVKRRMEVRGVIGGVTVYDDFAHHPTAIETTLKGLRARVAGARIVAVLEPRSNTMKLGVHRGQLAAALEQADLTWFLNSPDLGWDLPVSALKADSRPGDQVLIMSNGGFGGLHDKLLAALRERT